MMSNQSLYITFCVISLFINNIAFTKDFEKLREGKEIYREASNNTHSHTSYQEYKKQQAIIVNGSQNPRTDGEVSLQGSTGS